MAHTEADETRFLPLKAQLAAALKKAAADFSEADWHLLVDARIAEDWAAAPGEAKKLEVFNSCLAFLHLLRRRDAEQCRERALPRDAKNDAQPELESESLEGGSRVERQYAAILLHAAAVQASTMAQGFRSTYLGGRAITVAEARTLLDSPLARLWGRAHFEAAGIPVVGHRVPDITASPGRSPMGHVQLQVRGAGARGKSVAIDGPTYFMISSTTLVEIPGPPPFMEPRRVPVLPGSVLHELGKASATLARTFFWSESASVWFVLTGQLAATPAVAARLRRTADGSRAKIEIEALPFVLPSAVANAFTRIRQLIAGTRAARRPRPRLVRLLAFMAKHRLSRVSPAHYDDFSRAHPASRYQGGWRNAARDFRTETDLLLGPQPRKPTRGKKMKPRKTISLPTIRIVASAIKERGGR